MGASGLPGDFARVLMRNSRIPVYVQKSGSLPRFVDNRSLVIAISYSGKTRETLDALNDAISAGAKVVVMTTSAELGNLCAHKGIPWICIPDAGFPRAALGYMLICMLGILQRLGILSSSVDADVSEAIRILKEIRKKCGPEIAQKSNPAWLLALALAGKVPVIYAESEFSEVIALRWKQQLNENAKIHCYYAVFPELLHNEIEAWHYSDYSRQNYAVVILRDAIHEQETRLGLKIEATRHLMESRGVRVYDLWTKGTSELARLLSLCYLGDFISVYLALSRGIDPGPVYSIQSIKKIGLASPTEVKL